MLLLKNTHSSHLIIYNSKWKSWRWKRSYYRYKDNQEIQNKVCEFLDLFNIEIDNMFNDWTEKDLQEYYNSAIGADLKGSNSNSKEPVEEVVGRSEEVVKLLPVKAAPKQLL